MVIYKIVIKDLKVRDRIIAYKKQDDYYLLEKSLSTDYWNIYRLKLLKTGFNKTVLDFSSFSEDIKFLDDMDDKITLTNDEVEKILGESNI